MEKNEVLLRLFYLGVIFDNIDDDIKRRFSRSELRRKLSEIKEEAKSLSIEEIERKVVSIHPQNLLWLNRYKGFFTLKKTIDPNLLSVDDFHNGIIINGMVVHTGDLLKDLTFGSIDSRVKSLSESNNLDILLTKIPIIIKEVGQTFQVMFGNHRALSAIIKGYGKLDVLILSKEDSEENSDDFDLEDKSHINLKDHTNEVENHYKKGLQRVKDYYNGRSESPALIDPPHEILVKVASQFFRESTESFLIKSDVDLEKYWDSSLFEVCVGCGTEILMKAIILSKKPDKIAGNLEMGFSKTKEILMGEVLKELNYNQRERINDVLELILLKRNKWAHLSFHKFDAYYENYQIFNLLEFLYKKFFPNSDILEYLKEQKEFYKSQGGMDLEPVEFR